MKKNSDKLIKYCPLCDEKHNLEIRTRKGTTIIKDEHIEYEEQYYLCPNSDEEENEFVDGKLHNANMLNARNAYRIKKGLLTSYDIVQMREDYNLSQVDLSKILGWGEATISRYESNLIQYEAYDSVLRMLRLNSYMAYGFLKKNKDKFSEEKYQEITDSITNHIKSQGREYLKRQVLESEYIDFEDKSQWNGYSSLNIDRIECIISYFATYVKDLHKIKLMKLLWYADMINCKKYGKSITGLVYRHHAMGALPIGHDEIIELDNVIVNKIEVYESVQYDFCPNTNLSMSILEDYEIDVLDIVISRFKDYTTKDIVEYMHKEKAYVETMDMEVISYEYAHELLFDV